MKQAAKELGYKTASLEETVEKAMTAYQRKRMREDAANSLHNHHLSKIRGNHEEADRHLETAHKLSQQAGGPTKKMMQSRLKMYQEEHAVHTKRMTGSGVQRVGGKLAGGYSTLDKMAKENLQAAQQAAAHPLVGHKAVSKSNKSTMFEYGSREQQEKELQKPRTLPVLTMRESAKRRKRKIPEPVIHKAKSNKWISDKIRLLRHEGKPQDQAVAIAHNMAGRSRDKAEKSIPLRPDLIGPRRLRVSLFEA